MKKKLKFPAVTIEKIPSIIFYFLMLVFYIIMEKCSSQTSSSKEFFLIFDHPLPKSALAGFFSSISMIIHIFWVVFYRKIGFYTSIALFSFRVIKITKGLLQFHPTGLPALSITLIGILSVLLIYIRNERFLKAQERHRLELEEFTNSIIDAFSVCIDGKDSYTNGHSLRVAQYTRMLAIKLGESEDVAQKFYNIALLHDIGKIGIPDDILNKPGKLTDEEYDIVKTHPYRGFEILKRVKSEQNLINGAKCHHERFDGKGYPARLMGEKIPWVARIISVADAFDAMSSTRPYRKKQPMNYIIQEFKNCSGGQFDPTVVKAFLDLYEEGKFDNLVTE